MGCYQCGSPEGTLATLCPSCIRLNQDRMRARQSQIRQELTIAPQRDLVYEMLSNPAYWAFGGLVLAIVSCTGFFVFPPVPDAPATASIIYGLVVTVGLISSVTWVFFWTKLVVLSPYWAMGSFMIPALVYRYIFLNFDENKVVFFAHIISVLLTVILTVSLANVLDISFFEALFLLRSKQHELGVTY